VGTIVAGMTAFYMTRMLVVTFYGESRMTPEVESHVHENSRVMTTPLIILAVLAVIGGYVGIPANLQIGPLAALHDRVDIVRWLEPVTGGHGEAHGAVEAEHAALPGASAGSEEPRIVLASQELAVQEPAAQEQVAAEDHGDEVALEWALMLTSVAVAMTGIGVAWKLYSGGPQAATRLQERFPALYRLLFNKYWVDEFYDAAVVNRVKDIGNGLDLFDGAVIDGVVNGTAAATLQSAHASNEFDERVIDGAVDGVGNGLWAQSWIFRSLQTGRVQNYALIITLGVFVLVSAWLFL
jgi:NADH-quinone oxidoreductase subunit L